MYFQSNVPYGPTLWESFPDIKKRYAELACEIAHWSKDTTKVGAVAVGKHGQILTQGYNGFPRGYPDNYTKMSREIKHKLSVHAEQNAIYNACLSGVSLEGADLYLYGLSPCQDCAKGIIQTGIKRVICWENFDIIKDHWQDSQKYALRMFEKCGVDFYKLTPYDFREEK